MFDSGCLRAALVTARQAMAHAAGLAAVEPLPGAAAVEVLAQLDEVRRHVELLTVLAAERVDRSGAFADDGSKSTKAFLRKACAESDGWAARQVRVGRELADRMPATRQAWADGKIGAVHADIIRSAIKDLDAELAAEIEKTLADAAPDVSLADLSALAELIRQQAVPDEAADRDRKNFDRQHLTLAKTMDGQYDLRGRLNAESGAFVTHILDTLMRKLGAGKPGDGVPPPAPGLRRGLALVELARQAAGHAERCDPSKTSRPTIIVSVDEQTLADGYGAADLEGGCVIGGRAAQRLACDATIICASSRDGQILDLGRKTRTVSQALRAYLIARDGGCVFEGCDAPASACEAHHIIFWINGGLTDRSNLILVCHCHHRLVHDDGWQVIGTARAPDLHFRSPDGQTKIPAQRRPLIPRAPSLLKL